MRRKGCSESQETLGCMTALAMESCKLKGWGGDMVEFTPETIRNIFGAEDAENESAERLKEYFYRNRAYESLLSDLPIRIVVGHKGVGKSALLKMAHLEDLEHGRPTIWLQPSDLTTLDGTYDPRFDKAALAWQQGLLKVLYEKIETSVFGSVVSENSGMVLATSRDFISALKKLAEKHLSFDQTELEKAAVSKYTSGKKILVYLDDLDRGWKGTKPDILRLSALLNALRDICGDFTGIQFRIGLRSDVYYLVRTSDESTDKIAQYLIPLNWSNHDILVCIAKRTATYFGERIDDAEFSKLPQIEIARRIHKVIDERFLDRGKWENAPIHRVLLSLTRRRPRDLVKMLSGAASVAYENRHQIISSEDLRSTFVDYSQDRLQDIINEFRSEVPNIKALLLGMRPTAVHRFGDKPFLYKTDELSLKIKNILSSNHIHFSSGESADFHAVKQFLYKIDFILARAEAPDGRITWTYFDENRFAASREADFGFSWEVHPAYRWALERRSVQEIIDGTDLTFNP